MNELVTINSTMLVPSKVECQQLTNNILNMIAEGEINALQAHGILTAIKKIAEDALKANEDAAYYEACKYPRGLQSDYGFDFQVKEVGVKYDCTGDSEYDQLKEQRDAIDLMMKSREVILKGSGQAVKTATEKVVSSLRKN